MQFRAIPNKIVNSIQYTNAQNNEFYVEQQIAYYANFKITNYFSNQYFDQLTITSVK